MRQEYVERNSHCHCLKTDKILAEMETDPESGLSEEEAAERLARFGANKLPEKAPPSLFIQFIKHFNDILIYVLFASALITLILGHYVDTAVILLVAVINALIGFIQENKAEKALADIKNLLPGRAMVVRGGGRKDLESAELTLGDIVILNPGDRVPADMRLIRADNLRVEESALTGESAPVKKTTDPVEPDALLGDRKNMAYSSTTVMTGSGRGVVTAIGEETEIGHINQLINEVEPLSTPLLRQTARFGKMVSAAVIALAVLVYLFGHFFRSYQSGELLLAVIGLSVAAIPEGLPAILSIILAIGVQNMAKRKAIVRNLPSVEPLGSVTVICSNKTGTLTQNEMTVREILTKDGDFCVSGTGYAPEGTITENGREPDFEKDNGLEELLTCLAVCNEAELSQDENGHWSVKGDPTEGALLTLYRKSGLDAAEGLTRRQTIPFDSQYKYMATLIKNGDQGVVYIKGAPDRLLDMASKEPGLDRAFWEDKNSSKARSGYRLIGGAIKLVEGDYRLTPESLELEWFFWAWPPLSIHPARKPKKRWRLVPGPV